MTSEHPPIPDGFPRRDFLRRSATVGAAAVAGPSLLAACTGGGDEEPKRRKDPDNPLGVDGARSLEIVVHKGVYGDDYAQVQQEIYRRRYPDAKIEHAPLEAIDKLRTRFVGGNPPDIVDNSGGRRMDLSALVNQGAVENLKDLLDAPSLDFPGKTVEETLVPGALEGGTFGDSVYAIPYVMTAWGFWYDAKTFRENGWDYPKDWEGLLGLCEQIKSSGTMAPFTWQGQDPAYLRFPMHAMAFRIGGEDVWKAIDNLEPDAWQNDAILRALEAWYQLAQNGYLAAGASALTPRGAQTNWLRRKAALIPCGSWLEYEMKGKIPEDFEMTLAPPPSVTTSDKVPNDALSFFATEPFVVPTNAKNVAGGLEYLRIMCSREGAERFAELTRSATLVAGVHDEQNLGSAFESTTEVVKKAQQLPRVPNPRYTDWYKSLADEVEAALAALMTKKATPDETVARIQKKADAVVKDTKIIKRAR